ncbi:MAG: LptF/LptG family permease [Pseudomonadota bacterium]
MQRIQRYIFRECLGVFAGLLALIVSILLLERLLRIADFVSRSPGNLTEAGLMLVNLIPHYAGIGIPAAFFLAVLITVSRMSRSGELVAIWGVGKSLFMISRPFMVLSLVLAIVLLVVSAYLQPLTRYEYRSLVGTLAESSAETVFSEGKFVEAENWTVWTERVDRSDGALQSSFILERLPEGGRRIIVSEAGRLVRADGTIAEIQLDGGMGAEVKPNGTLRSQISFESLIWQPPGETSQFRARGKDVRELTIVELWQRTQSSAGFDAASIPTLEAQVSIHDQLARFTLILILPLIAVPFGLSYGRNPPSNAILIGLVTLIAIQQALELGKSLSLDGAVPYWAGSWSVIGVLMVLAAALFLRSSLTLSQPPLSALPSLNLSRARQRPEKSLRSQP